MSAEGPFFSGQTFSASVEMKFTDAEEYEQALYGRARMAPASAHFEATFPRIAREDLPRLVLWGARGDDVQAGSPADRMREMRAAGEIRLTIPRVEWVPA